MLHGLKSVKIAKGNKYPLAYQPILNKFDFEL